MAACDDHERPRGRARSGRRLPPTAERRGTARGVAKRDPGVSVRLTDVSVGYDDRPVLDHVDLTLETGALTAVVGPNGGGKSTLLKLIAGLLKPWSGSLSVLGAAPGFHAPAVAYVPQAESVDWSFPVCAADVVMMGRYPRLGPLRRPGVADQAAVMAALDQVGMSPFARRQIEPCPAASGAGCSSPARSRASRSCTCSTSRSPGSMPPPRKT